MGDGVKPFLYRILGSPLYPVRSGTLLPVICTLLFSVTLGGCSQEDPILAPRFTDEVSELKGTSRLSGGADSLLSGVYLVEAGNQLLGDRVAISSIDGQPSIFCEPDATYMILEGGRKQDRVILEGYWRNGFNQKAGLVRLAVAPELGGRELVAGQGSAAEVVLTGSYGSTDGRLTSEIRLRRESPLTGPDFLVIGHRGGGRNADDLPFSENSLELLRFAPRLGCNAVEIDVQLTSDDVPILFHDAEFSTRLVRQEYLVGPVRNYSLKQVRQFATLLNGERIPTLEEALKEIRKVPEIRFVWIDLKSPDALRAALPIIAAENRKNQGGSDDVRIVAGLPLAPVYEAYRSLDDHDDVPALCELSVAEARAIDAAVWAPRWTLGLQESLLEQMQAEGRSVFVWTVDLPEFIDLFIEAGYDGVLSNYPTLVAWNHFVGRGSE